MGGENNHERRSLLSQVSSASLLTVSGVWRYWERLRTMEVSAEDYFRYWINKAVSILVVFLIAMTWYSTEATYRKRFILAWSFMVGKSWCWLKQWTLISWVCQEPEASCWPIANQQKAERDKNLQGLMPLLPLIKPCFLKATQIPGTKYSNNKSVWNLTYKPPSPWS